MLRNGFFFVQGLAIQTSSSRGRNYGVDDLGFHEEWAVEI
jgi:hypothetical protein